MQDKDFWNNPKVFIVLPQRKKEYFIIIMSDIINLLPDAVANQIAAGEVIQRPASVVKELLENAIDAGAKSIKLIIEAAGNTLVQVIDDGKGMSMTDARMSFERHATSKIKEADDLLTICTMGFRGEALASIAAIAQVELKTRQEDDELGVFIEIAGSRVFKQEHVQAEKGTSISVKSLFFNVPARRRFLKSHTTEMLHIRNEFFRVVLVHPEVHFGLFEDGTETFHLSPTTLKSRIENVFSTLSKKRMEQQLLPVQTDSPLLQVKGFVGRPEFAQKSAHQYFFVNGRYMRHPYFHKAVMVAYDQLLKVGQNPNYFIYLQVDPSLIDVNIHPAKTEIKFENERAIWAMLLASVKEVLGKFQVTPSLDFNQEDAPDIPVYQSSTHIVPPTQNFNPSYNPFRSTAMPSNKEQTTGWEQLYTDKQLHSTEPLEIGSRMDTTHLDGQHIIVEEEKQTEMELSIEQKDCYQFRNSYILTSVKSGLLMIHQHRAHFRVLFDRLMRQSKDQKRPSQQVLFPEILELDINTTEKVSKILPELLDVGFDIELFGKNAFKVSGVPAELGGMSPIPLLHEMIEKVFEIKGETQQIVKEKIVLLLAKKSSIKKGKPMSDIEMSDLIGELFTCENHVYTPDGKSIIQLITEQEIVSKFQ